MHFVRNGVGQSLYPRLETPRAENHILTLLLRVLPLCLQSVYVHHLSVFVAIHVMVNNRGVWRSRGAPCWKEWDAPSVTKTKTRACHSMVSLQCQNYSSPRELCSSTVYAQCDTNVKAQKDRGQKVKKWDATSICSVAVHGQFQWVAFLAYFSWECNGADLSQWLNFTCFMVNKSSQDFGGLVST